MAKIGDIAPTGDSRFYDGKFQIEVTSVGPRGAIYTYGVRDLVSNEIVYEGSGLMGPSAFIKGVFYGGGR